MFLKVISLALCLRVTCRDDSVAYDVCVFNAKLLGNSLDHYTDNRLCSTLAEKGATVLVDKLFNLFKCRENALVGKNCSLILNS